MIEYTVRVYANRTEWRIEGKLHREDGPAIEYTNGGKTWYIDGKLHREDGPACESSSGDKEWYIEGKLHREDGPALEYANGEKYWNIEGRRLTEKQFNQRVGSCMRFKLHMHFPHS